MIVALRDVQQSSELLQGNFLVAKINRRNSAPGDADDFLTLLRAKQKRRWRRGNGNSRLQDKVRAEEEKEDQEKDNIDERENHEPTEIVFLGSAQFHADRVDVDLAIAACAIEWGAALWTLNRSDFDDVPGLTLFGE